MRVIKVKSKKVYLNKETKKEFHYYNYYLECNNGKRILIKAVLDDDKPRLDMIADYEG